MQFIGTPATIKRKVRNTERINTQPHQREPHQIHCFHCVQSSEVDTDLGGAQDMRTKIYRDLAHTRRKCYSSDNQVKVTQTPKNPEG